jgi:hypothetical protein
MRRFGHASVVMAVVVGGCVTAPARYVPAGSTIAVDNDFADRILALHNRERAGVGEQPLAWDPVLAAGAASYAQTLALTGTFAHSDGRSRGGVGENLWMGTRGGFTVEQMIGAWVSERRMFVPGVFPRVSRTGRWSEVGHYSQMIWPATTRVGCAIASSRSADFLVCRYAPAGNIDGRRVP